MEAWKRIFSIRDCLRGVKLILLGLYIGGSILFWVVLSVLSRGQSPGGLFTFTIVSLALWVVFAVGVNRLRQDPYYSFELVPSAVAVYLILQVIIGLVAENIPYGTDWASEGARVMVSYFGVPMLIFGAISVYFFCGIGSLIALPLSGSQTQIRDWASKAAADAQALFKKLPTSPTPPSFARTIP